MHSVILDTPISATAILAEIAEELVRVALADHPDEKTVSLLAISLSHLEQHWTLQLELPLGLEDEKRRPGPPRGMARWTADRDIDLIRHRFGWMRSDTAQSYWGHPGPFQMNFASSPKRTFESVFSPRKLTIQKFQGLPHRQRHAEGSSRAAAGPLVIASAHHAFMCGVPIWNLSRFRILVVLCGNTVPLPH